MCRLRRTHRQAEGSWLKLVARLFLNPESVPVSFPETNKGKKRRLDTKRNVSGETRQFQIYGPEATYDDT
jgi:hypothetical protein